MSMIKDKIDNGQVNHHKNSFLSLLMNIFFCFLIQYKSEQDIFDDFTLMFNNAKSYNLDESYIFKNACQLQSALSTKYKKLLNKKEKLIQNLMANRSINQGIVKK